MLVKFRFDPRAAAAEVRAEPGPECFNVFRRVKLAAASACGVADASLFMVNSDDWALIAEAAKQFCAGRGSAEEQGPPTMFGLPVVTYWKDQVPSGTGYLLRLQLGRPDPPGVRPGREVRSARRPGLQRGVWLDGRV